MGCDRRGFAGEDTGSFSREPAIHLVSVNTALAQPLFTPQGLVQSGIRKQAREGRVAVRPLGLEGDQSVHGGLAKAVYAYPEEHYAFWTTVRGQARQEGALTPGAMGENLTLRGVLENQLWLGDVLRFPDCELVVSEPRLPCFKFAAVMGFPQAVKLMAQSGYCGAYLAVKREGSLAAGEAFELLPGAREVSLTELFRSRAKRL
jgi:MOSC domain-containing protein YiiM